MSIPDQTLPDHSDRPIPGAEQFLAGQAHEEAGELGQAVLHYEKALRINFAQITEPDSAERGGVWAARERLIEIYTGMGDTFAAQGETKMATACRQALARAESWPGHVTSWDEGLREENIEYSDPQPGQVTD